MLDSFDDVRVRELLLFDRVVERGSITAAARELGIAKATASRWLAMLEDNVGAPLMRRGARHIVLTERGTALQALLPALLRNVRALRAVAREAQPGGTLRVSVPVPLGRVMGGSVIAAFRRELPGVRLEVVLSNGPIDLLRDRLDLAIRGGPLPDSDLVAHRLTTIHLRLYASPRYEGLSAAEIPVIAAPGDEERLAQQRPDMPPAAVIVDDRTAVRDALLAGAGAGVLPAFLGEPERAQGLLILVDAEPVMRVPVHAVYLPEQRDDLRVRTLLTIVSDHLRHWATGAPTSERAD